MTLKAKSCGAGCGHFKGAVPAVAVGIRDHDRLQFGLSGHFVGGCAGRPLVVGRFWMGGLAHVRRPARADWGGKA
jgi:hypothetical protein